MGKRDAANSGRNPKAAVAALRWLLGTRGGRLTLVVTLLAAAGWWLYDAHLRPRRPGGPSLRVATWNLRQFSANRDDLDYDGLARRIKDWRFGVVALQEVKGDGAAVGRLVDALNAGPLLGGSWRSELGPATGNGERFAFVYDADAVRFLGLVPLPSQTLLRIDRLPLAGRFRSGDFDFTLVAVHLFASDAARRRGESAQVALSLLAKSLPAGERDVIVAGDFNTTTKRGGGGGALGPFLAAGWEVLNDAPTNLKGDAVYDNLLIDPAATREWTGRVGVEPLGVANDVARRTLSDHLPVWADFAVTGPDDD